MQIPNHPRVTLFFHYQIKKQHHVHCITLAASTGPCAASLPLDTPPGKSLLGRVPASSTEVLQWAEVSQPNQETAPITLLDQLCDT